MFDFCNQIFANDAIECAWIRDDGENGNTICVPCANGGCFETTDEGLSAMKQARGTIIVPE